MSQNRGSPRRRPMSDLIADLRQKLAENNGPRGPWVSWFEFDEVDEADVFRVVDANGRSFDLEEDLSPEAKRLLVAAVNALPGLLDEITVSRQLIDHLTQPPPDGGWTVGETQQWHTRRKALLDAYEQARAANG
jgi:hypothetical protein